MTGIKIKGNECTFFLFPLWHFWLKKVHFSHCFIQNWEETEYLKNEKSPWSLFSHFRTNPVKDFFWKSWFWKKSADETKNYPACKKIKVYEISCQLSMHMEAQTNNMIHQLLQIAIFCFNLTSGYSSKHIQSTSLLKSSIPMVISKSLKLLV